MVPVQLTSLVFTFVERHKRIQFGLHLPESDMIKSDSQQAHLVKRSDEKQTYPGV